MSYNVGHQIGNFCWQLCETFSGRNVVSCWIKKLFAHIVIIAIVHPDLTRFFCILSLGVNDYPWEIVGMDYVTDFTKSSELHLTTIIDSCLPSETAHFLSCHDKSPLKTKP